MDAVRVRNDDYPDDFYTLNGDCRYRDRGQRIRVVQLPTTSELIEQFFDERGLDASSC